MPKIGQQYLEIMDTMDFDVFSHQDWSRLRESHSQDVTVHWPDGRVTHGIEAHVADMKKLFG